MRLIAGAAEAIARLNARGIPVVVATNQAGVARGYFPESRVGEVHAHLDQLLAEHSAHIDRYYVCPHHPREDWPRIAARVIAANRNPVCCCVPPPI